MSYKSSLILETIIPFSAPYIILFGIYITLNGPDSPGGGFQGGAILATILMSRYLVVRQIPQNFHFFKCIEKILFVSILALISYILFYYSTLSYLLPKPLYLYSMNILIGLKVCLGLTMIFYAFMHHQSTT